MTLIIILIVTILLTISAYIYLMRADEEDTAAEMLGALWFMLGLVGVFLEIIFIILR